MVLTARPIERIVVSPAPMMDDFLPPRCDLGTVGADARVFVCTCIKCFKSVDARCELCSGDAYRKQVDVFCNACLRADASIGASLESCAACSALSAADVQRAAAAAGGAASVATPPRTTANTVQSRPPCAATGAKRKAADHRCIECGNASVDAAGANLC
jgi:hypothetical protein